MIVCKETIFSTWFVSAIVEFLHKIIKLDTLVLQEENELGMDSTECIFCLKLRLQEGKKQKNIHVVLRKI